MSTSLEANEGRTTANWPFLCGRVGQWATSRHCECCEERSVRRGVILVVVPRLVPGRSGKILRRVSKEIKPWDIIS